MRKIGLIVTALWLVACAGTGPGVDRPASKNVVDLQQQEEEYEILIIDPGFETWMITNSRPIWYHSPQYYRQKNILYVSDWNSKVHTLRYRSPFTEEINYDPATDYGVEVDYQLFWYFKYIHRTYGGRYSFPA